MGKKKIDLVRVIFSKKESKKERNILLCGEHQVNRFVEKYKNIYIFLSRLWKSPPCFSFSCLLVRLAREA